MWPWGTIKKLRDELASARSEKTFWFERNAENKATAQNAINLLDGKNKRIEVQEEVIGRGKTLIDKLEAALAEATSDNDRLRAVIADLQKALAEAAKNDQRDAKGRFRKAGT